MLQNAHTLHIGGMPCLYTNMNYIRKKAYVFMVYLKLCYESIPHSGKQPRTKHKNTHILVTA